MLYTTVLGNVYLMLYGEINIDYVIEVASNVSKCKLKVFVELYQWII